MRVLSSRRKDNSSIKLTKVVCSWAAYATGDTKRFLIQLVIRKEKGSPSGKTRPATFSNLDYQKTSGHTIHWQSLFLFFYSESCTSLQILMRWKCCSTNLCPRSLEKPLTNGSTSSGSSGGDGQRYRGGHTNFVLGFRAEIGKEHLIFLFSFFFSADWRKSMQAHSEKHRKKTCLA